MTNPPTSLPEQFLLALSTFDGDALAELLANDAVGWRNVGNRDRSVEEIIASLEVEQGLVRSSTVHVQSQSTTDEGFVAEFVFEGTTSGGGHFRLPICIVAHVVDGRIARFNEYTDEASMRPLQEAFLAAAASTSEVTS